MCEKRHAAALLSEGAESHQDLIGKPEHNEPNGRDLGELDEDKDRDERGDARARVEGEIRAEHSADGARGTDHGDLARRVYKDLCCGGTEATQHVKQDEAWPPEVVFDIVAKDVEKPHVADDVEKAAMHKHVRDESAERAQGACVEQFKRNQRVALNKKLLGLRREHDL